MGVSMAPPAADAPPERLPTTAKRCVHRTFHRLDRSCARDGTDVPRLDAITRRFSDLYRRYPADRFGMAIDGERGTMLSALLVLRRALASCSPPHAARLDALLPERIRRALTPLPPPS